MALSSSPNAPRSGPGGRLDPEPRQADPGVEAPESLFGDRRGLRLRTLIVLRWASLLGQATALLWVWLILKFDVPILPCLVVLAGATLVNLAFGLGRSPGRVAREREALLHLGFDLLVITLLVMLTGGLANPFVLLMMAPVVVGAAVLPARHALALGVVGLLLLLLTAVLRLPLPWTPGAPLTLPPLYVFGIGVATAMAMVFTAAYAWQVQAESQRMELALAATQAVLAREQRLSALGSLAAAAAHELGTPLATIQVVTKEMSRGLPAGSALADDVALLISQAERCREILRQLSRKPEASDSHHERMSLTLLLEEVARPNEDPGILINTDVTCAPGAAIMEVRRRPEVLHGLSAFIENAVDFAESVVDLSAYYDADRLTITVRDDGPGFSADVLGKLGEPYVTTRSHGENSRSGHLGMGLGFFIAKTLLERSGARVEFFNAPEGGAVVAARWARARIEAQPET